MSKELQPVSQPAVPARERVSVSNPVALFDTARFEHYQRIAMLMARASMIPKHLKVFEDGRDTGPVDVEATLGNCLMVVNQADRWKMDPFALAQSTFRTPGGQLGYEGKAVSAALESVYGIELDYEFFGEEGSDERGVTARGPRPGSGKIAEIKGTVAQWKTFEKSGSIKAVWKNQPDDQLIYRSTRQWCRRYAPGVIMGIVTEDEIDDQQEEMRAQNARRVGPDIAGRLSAGGAGFDPVGIQGALADMRGQTVEIAHPETGEIVEALVVDCEEGRIRGSSTELAKAEYAVTIDGKLVKDREHELEPTRSSNRDESTGDKATAGDSTPQGARGKGQPAGREEHTREGEENRDEAGTADRGGESSPKKSAARPAGQAAADRAASTDAPDASSSKAEEGAARSNEPEESKERAGPQPNSTKETDSSGSAEPDTRSEAELDALVKNYNSALWKAMSGEEFTTARTAFWKKNQKPQDERTRDSLKAVSDIHVSRIKGDTSRDQATADLAEIIGDQDELEL